MIPVKNIYYMLSYAFQVLTEQGYKDVATEEFDNVADLCSAIICKGMSVQIKRGLLREYIENTDALSTLRGRLEIGESIKDQTLMKKQMVCSYDEFSANAYLNRIIKTTLLLLLKSDIPGNRKKDIRKILVFLMNVDELDLHQINWNITYNRNNRSYISINE